MWPFSNKQQPAYEYDSWTRQAWTLRFGFRAVFVMEHGGRGKAPQYTWEIWTLRDIDLDYVVVSEVDSLLAKSAERFASVGDAKRSVLLEAYRRWGVVFRGHKWVREATGN